ncbi:MAG: phosphatidate cytidylyltransferase [Bryobacteraceae bacterium]
MKRVVTAAILAPLVLAAVLGPWFLPFAVAVTAVAVLCHLEYVGLAGLRQHPLAVAGGAAAGLFLLWSPRFTVLTLVGVALIALALSLRQESTVRMLPDAAAAVFGILYCFGPWLCARLLRDISPYWLVYALAVNWIGDIAAYYGGSRWGRRKLAPQISPGKSWEGAAASVAGSVVFGLVFARTFLPAAGLAEILGLSVAANVAGQLGDLCESAIKRGAGSKDSGAFLPGHGGMLDRVDASLFTLPVVYLWLGR